MILAFVAAALAPGADMAVGRWRTQTDGGVVEIARCGGSICGRIVGSNKLRTNPGLLDAHNSNAGLRGRRLLGLQILGGFHFNDGTWTGGTIYNADDGGTYKATVTPIDSDHLKVRGCIVWPLCKSQTWTRMR